MSEDGADLAASTECRNNICEEDKQKTSIYGEDSAQSAVSGNKSDFNFGRSNLTESEGNQRFP